MDPAFWNARYAENGFAYGEAPNAFLAEQAAAWTRALDILVPADGEGRNGVWLAEQRHRVATIDFSAVAVEKALALADRRGVRIQAACADLRTLAWPNETFDVVVLIYLHLPPDDRALVHHRVAHVLRPGGKVLIEAFSPEQAHYRPKYNSGGPADPALLYSAQMLREDFTGFEIEALDETVVDLTEGAYHYGKAGVVRGVLLKPEL